MVGGGEIVDCCQFGFIWFKILQRTIISLSHNDYAFYDAADDDDAAAADDDDADDEEVGVQSKTVHEIVPFRFRLLLSSNGRSGIKREHSEGSYHDEDDDNFEDDYGHLLITPERIVRLRSVKYLQNYL